MHPTYEGDDLTKRKLKARFPLVSIIIVNFNGSKFVKTCVDSVLKSNYPNFEIVIVDNASTDGSYETLLEKFGNVRKVTFVHNAQNLGFAEGNNVGYENSKGEVVVFLNADTEVESTWLNELTRALASGRRVGGVQSKLMNMKDRKVVDSIGFHLDWLGFVYPRSDVSAGFSSEELFYPDGAAMAFRADVLREAALDGEPFDPDYFLYFEDTDLGWRVRLRAYRIILVPISIVYHSRGASASSTSRASRAFLFTRNRFMTLIKNYSLANLARFMPIVVLAEIAQIAVLLPSEPRKSTAKLSALLWCLVNLREVWRKRVFVQLRVRIVPDSDVLRHMLMPNISTLIQGSATLY